MRLRDACRATCMRRATSSSNSEEFDLGPVGPAGFFIPEVDAFNHAAFSGQVNDAGGAAVCNHGANHEFFPGAVSEADDHAVKTNGAAADAKLNRPERAVVMPDPDAVVVDIAIDVSVAQMNHMFVLRSCDGRDRARNASKPKTENAILRSIDPSREFE